MLPYRDSRLLRFALAAFFLLAVAYGYYEVRGLLLGPNINLPPNVPTVHERFIDIKGEADRISELSIDGKPVSVTESGAFDEVYLLSPGYNRTVLDAKDKYGRRSERVIEIMYEPDASSTSATSSTPAVAQ